MIFIVALSMVVMNVVMVGGQTWLVVIVTGMAFMTVAAVVPRVG